MLNIPRISDLGLGLEQWSKWERVKRHLLRYHERYKSEEAKAYFYAVTLIRGTGMPKIVQKRPYAMRNKPNNSTDVLTPKGQRLSNKMVLLSELKKVAR